MPPKVAAATASTTRRKAPSFKPPRPVDTTTQNATTSKRTAAPPSAPKSRSLPAAEIISSDDEPEQDEFDLPSDLDELMEDAPQEDTRSKATAILQSNPPIPAPLLTRIVSEHFEDDGTKIQRGAMDLLGSYMSIFVREALLRAKEQRSNSAQRGERAEGSFLQVDDLESITPQLVLDF